MTDKLSNFFPRPVELPLLNDKVARIGPFTLTTMLWVEETYGDFEKFTEMVFNEGLKSLKEKSEFLFELLLNKEDFKDVKDFRDHFPLANMFRLAEVITEVMDANVPTVEASEDGAGEGEGKK